MDSLQNLDYRAVIHFGILFDQRLNANHLRFYGLIEQMESNPKASPRFSFQWIANQLNISRRHAMRLASELKKFGYLEHREISKGKWVWSTKVAEVVEELDTNAQSGDAGCHPLVTQDVTPLVTQDVTLNTQNINTQKNKHICAPDDARSSFEQFWGFYPKKKDKARAQKTWDKLPESDKIKAIEGIQTQIKMCKSYQSENKAYIPHATTYLNGRRWEDEISPYSGKFRASEANNSSSWYEKMGSDIL